MSIDSYLPCEWNERDRSPLLEVVNSVGVKYKGRGEKSKHKSFYHFFLSFSGLLTSHSFPLFLPVPSTCLLSFSFGLHSHLDTVCAIVCHLVLVWQIFSCEPCVLFCHCTIIFFFLFFFFSLPSFHSLLSTHAHPPSAHPSVIQPSSSSFYFTLPAYFLTSPSLAHFHNTLSTLPS